jgi:hypothetical protein
MSDAVDVRCERSGAGWACRVTVTGGGTSTRHEVAVAGVDLGRLDPGATDPTDLVRRSFAFLLAREAKESILRRFELPVMGRYFPDWEEKIRGA